MKTTSQSLLLAVFIVAIALGWWTDATRRAQPYFLHLYYIKDKGTSKSLQLFPNQTFCYSEPYSEIKGDFRARINGFELKLDASIPGGAIFRIDRRVEIGETFSASGYLSSGEIHLCNGVITKSPIFEMPSNFENE